MERVSKRQKKEKKIRVFRVIRKVYFFHLFRNCQTRHHDKDPLKGSFSLIKSHPVLSNRQENHFILRQKEIFLVSIKVLPLKNKNGKLRFKISLVQYSKNQYTSRGKSDFQNNLTFGPRLHVRLVLNL